MQNCLISSQRNHENTQESEAPLKCTECSKLFCKKARLDQGMLRALFAASWERTKN